MEETQLQAREKKGEKAAPTWQPCGFIPTKRLFVFLKNNENKVEGEKGGNGITTMQQTI